MVIKSLHIDAFGKFSDFDLQFNENFNMIFGRNEYGKTTLMNFIKLMFYADSSKSQDISKNPRKKYWPLHSDTMGGSIVFIYENQEIRLERTFGKTPRYDKVNLINITTGSSKKLKNTVNIGETFFNLTKEAFERTIFIGQLGNSPTTDRENEALTNRLIDLSIGGEENVSLSNAISALQSAKELYFSRSRKKGKSDKLKVEIEDSRRELETARKDEKEILDLKKKQDKLEKEINSLHDKINEYNVYMQINEKLNQIQLIKNKLSAFQEIEATEKAIEQRVTSLTNDGFTANREFTERIKAKINNIDVLTDSLEKTRNYTDDIEEDIFKIEDNLQRYDDNEISEKTKQILKNIDNAEAILQKKEDEYEQLLSQLYEAKAQLSVANSTQSFVPQENVENSKGGGYSIFILLSVLVFIAGVVCGIFIGPLYFIAAFLGIVFTAVFSSKNKSAKGKAKDDFIPEEPVIPDEALIDAQTLKFNRLDEACQGLKDDISKIKDYLKTQKVQLKEAEDEKHSLELDIAGYFSQKSQKKDELFRQQRTINEIQHNIEREKDSLLFAYSKYENVSNIYALKQSLQNIEATLEEIENLKARYDWQKQTLDLDEQAVKACAKKILNLRAEIDRYDVDPENVPDMDIVRGKINTANEKIDKLNKQKMQIVADNFTKMKNVANVSEIENRIGELTSELREQTELCEIYSIAQQMLQKTELDLRRNFAPKLNEKVKNLFGTFSGHNYNDAIVSKNFDINVKKKNGNTLNWRYLSNGTIDQLYFALRIALSEMMTENDEALPLILDDIFLQYDDVRVKNTLDFLKEYSKGCQIILFTCRKTFLDMFQGTQNSRKYSIKIHNPRKLNHNIKHHTRDDGAKN